MEFIGFIGCVLLLFVFGVETEKRINRSLCKRFQMSIMQYARY